MRVGVWLTKGLRPEVGGGFSYSDLFISKIDQHQFSDIDVVFITTQYAKVSDAKATVTIPWYLYLYIRIIKKFAGYLPYRLAAIWGNFAEKPAAKILRANGIDIIFYPTPCEAPISNYSFISNNWDIGHRSTFAFPELVLDTVFEKREKWYKDTFLKALAIFAESESGKAELVRYTGISPERVRVVPIFPGKSVDAVVSAADQEKILSKFKVSKDKYFFYPAQFWAHKNHFGLLSAFNLIKAEFPELKVVFTGSDKGNLQYIEQLVGNFELQDRVIFGGFVSNEEIASLYRNATALVMPSFFGPTNMPPLEALKLDCPVLCSDIPGHREMLGDGALYFNADDQHELVFCMKQILNPSTRQRILRHGQDVKLSSIFTVDRAIKELEAHLKGIRNVRLTWS